MQYSKTALLTTPSVRYFSRTPAPSVSSKLGRAAPKVTIIRPVKGVEPHLYDCIASTFYQDYPSDRISVRLCVEDVSDPAYPILTKLVQDFPNIDAQVFVETQDPVLHGEDGHVDNLGPNPKIRNISRAYREAQGDIIWVIDCNVWVARGVLGRMVDKLMGFTPKGQTKPYKFVHHMPLVVDIVDYFGDGNTAGPEGQTLLRDHTSITPHKSGASTDLIRENGGGRLDEMFMSTSHVKFYGAINIVGIAPCIVGKSNMFRKAHLEMVTNPAENSSLRKDDSRPTGIDYFSHHICEDHLIGDLLWRFKMPGYQNHGLVWGDIVIQPMADMSIVSYAARRCRWLRARKFTVLAATLVEPGVESFLCCAYFSFAATTLPWFQETLGIPPTWTAMGLIWFAAVTAWMVVDWFVFRHLHSGDTVQLDETTPRFAKGTNNAGGMPRRNWSEWFLAWLGREMLALPIWAYAVLLGTTVSWRGKEFRVNVNTTVVGLNDSTPKRSGKTPELERGRLASKDRVD